MIDPTVAFNEAPAADNMGEAGTDDGRSSAIPGMDFLGVAWALSVPLGPQPPASPPAPLAFPPNALLNELRSQPFFLPFAPEEESVDDVFFLRPPDVPFWPSWACEAFDACEVTLQAEDRLDMDSVDR